MTKILCTFYKKFEAGYDTFTYCLNRYDETEEIVRVLKFIWSIVSSKEDRISSKSLSLLNR